jgi:hypothetical protein
MLIFRITGPGGAPYKLNAVVTHSLKAPGFKTLEAIK